jgi:hypothetical protein
MAAIYSLGFLQDEGIREGNLTSLNPRSTSQQQLGFTSHWESEYSETDGLKIQDRGEPFLTLYH